MWSDREIGSDLKIYILFSVFSHIPIQLASYHS